MRVLAASLVAVLGLTACGSSGSGGGEGGAGGSSGAQTGDASTGGTGGSSADCPDALPADRFASSVVSFTPGEGAGIGGTTAFDPSDPRYPSIVFGPPDGAGSSQGGTDVLSLGKGGEIVLGFGDTGIVDEPGPDFIVFENAFLIGGNPMAVFSELGEVSVSQDGETWATFTCQSKAFPYTGCAGWHPVLANPSNCLPPDDPAKAGGDPFDLADVGLTSARFVRIRDLSNYGGTPNAGFDLDAVVVIHASEPKPHRGQRPDQPHEARTAQRAETR